MTEQTTSAKTYIFVYVALLVLLLLTYVADSIDMGSLNLVVALAVAICKTLLIVYFFMHVRTSERLIWLFATAGFLWLAILLGLTLSDFVTRIGIGAVGIG